ncbi:unnamed protein product [Soboliphyme baturini]|uniref:Uncharacterized protein n=1 Tax=Soboliphyme baturini TaxID=241478 RepID=A0A183J4F5_9BILA|nr:unnamed protein product [Soboliphyme baturini]
MRAGKIYRYGRCCGKEEIGFPYALNDYVEWIKYDTSVFATMRSDGAIAAKRPPRPSSVRLISGRQDPRREYHMNARENSMSQDAHNDREAKLGTESLLLQHKRSPNVRCGSMALQLRNSRTYTE